MGSQVLNGNHYAGCWENKVMTCDVEDAVVGDWDMGASSLPLGLAFSSSPALTFLVGFSSWLHTVAFCASSSSSSQVQVW